MQKKNIFLEKGFTLVEMLVAGGILGVLIVAGMNYFSNMQQSNNFLEFQMKREQLRTVILNQFLNFEDNCKCFFKNPAEFPEVGISKLAATPSDSIGRYQFTTEGDCSTATLGAVFLSKEGSDGLRLVNVELANIKKFPNSYAGDFLLYLRSTKKVVGPQIARLKIPVNVKTSAGAGSNKKFEGCSVTGTFASQLQSLLEKVIDVTETRCIRDTGGSTTHVVEKQCPAGTKLLSCSGGPGDIDHQHEGFWILPDYKTNTCRLSIVNPACVSSEPWTYQKVISLCYPE